MPANSFAASFRMTTRQKISMFCLSLLLVVLVARAFFKAAAPVAAGANVPVDRVTNHDAPPAKATARALPRLAPLTISLPTHIDHNPFFNRAFEPERPKTGESATPTVRRTETPVDPEQVAKQVKTDLSIRAVIFGQQRQAVINGQLYVVGQEVKGCQIVSIEQHRVVVRKDGVEVPLEF